MMKHDTCHKLTSPASNVVVEILKKNFVQQLNVISNLNIVTNNLTITKMTNQVQAEEKPKFHHVFVVLDASNLGMTRFYNFGQPRILFWSTY